MSALPPKYIAFDCEGTGLTSDKNALITCTVTIACPPITGKDGVRFWHSKFNSHMDEKDVVLLIDYMHNAFVKKQYKIVSYNGVGYDLQMLLRHITSAQIKEKYKQKIYDIAIGGTDIFLDFACEFGYYTSMQSFAEGCNLKGKTGNGKDAIAEWASCDIARQKDVLEYCKNDVLCLCRIYNFACKNGRLFRQTKAGKKMMWISRNRHIRTSGECMMQYTQQKPVVKWMKTPIDMSEKWSWIEF